MKRIVLTVFALFCTFQMAVCANPIIFGKSRITLITPTLFRIEYAEDGRFIDQPTMFAYDRNSLLDESQFSIISAGDRHEICTSSLKIQYWDNGYPFGEANLKVCFRKGGKDEVFTNRGIYNENMGASVESLDKLSDAVPLHDGLLARSGWYIVDDEGQDLLIDSWLRPRGMPAHIQDQYCFVYGDDYKAALKDLGAISGRVPMTRRYIHGVWFSRYWKYSDRDLLEIVDEYDSNGFPLDNLVIDMDWHEADGDTGTGGSGGKLYWTGYDWNGELFPNPVPFLSQLHSRGLNVSLNDHPHDGIRSSESFYPDFIKELGAERDSILLFNPADSSYMSAFFKYAHSPKIRDGVDFWWLDWQQNHIYHNVRGLKTPTLKWLNELYYRNSESYGQRGCNFSRWAGWGDHRHPVQFSGDAHITWPMLEFEIKLSSYGCGDGCYFWVHDIGGFKGIPDSEMNVRWAQFGAMSAALRIHSTNSEHLDRRPWLGPGYEVEALRKAYSLRSEIMPYVYSSVREVHEYMIPLNRPMFLEYPLSDHAYSVEQEYLFGDLLLVRPITGPGAGPRKIAKAEVWFPEGDVWYDWFTGQRIDGGKTISISKPLDQFPLYQKGGWLLPMQPYTSRPSLRNPEVIILKLFPSGGDCDNTYYLYEDDGVSMDYQNGYYSKTALRYIQKGNGGRVEIIEDGRPYNGKPSARKYILKYMKKDGQWKSVELKPSASQRVASHSFVL